MVVSLVSIESLSVEATARRAPNGDLFVICTCGGTKEPAPENQVYFFRSTDEGKTWTKKMISEEDGWAHYQTCTAVWNGKIYVFISRHNGNFVDWFNYLLVSADSGETWQKTETPLIKEYGFIRDMICLNNGKLLFPYHSYPVPQDQIDDCRARGVIICESKFPYVDNGVLIGDFENGFEKITAFKQPQEELCLWGGGKWRWTWSENTVVEAEDGHLIMLYRFDRKDYLWRTESFDCGKTWETPYQTDIPNPNNKPQLLKGKNGEILLIHTPNNKPAHYLHRRFPLEVWISRDNMKTWGKKIRISDFPGGYSYPDGFIDGDGKLKLAFEFNRHDVYFAEVEVE